tara:strand:+ start:156 stop:371 length:216 start_codon:yes stop_codon:yes gene_type:complete
MLYLKILGVFKALPLESLKVDFICGVTNSSIEQVKPILEKLLAEGHIKGKRMFKLAGKHKTSFIKNSLPPQ